jgi:hypothetical protein
MPNPANDQDKAKLEALAKRLLSTPPEPRGSRRQAPKRQSNEQRERPLARNEVDAESADGENVAPDQNVVRVNKIGQDGAIRLQDSAVWQRQRTSENIDKHGLVYRVVSFDFPCRTDSEKGSQSRADG